MASSLDSEGWRWILTSKQFGQCSADLCASIAEMTKLLCAETSSSKSIEPLIASRIIPLNKNPGLKDLLVSKKNSDVLLERLFQRW